MRIVLISDFGYVSGGAAQVAIESARALAEAGHEVVYASAIGPVCGRLAHPLIETPEFAGQNIWSVESKLAAVNQAVWNRPAGDFVRDLLAGQPRDAIVHVHQWSKAFSPSVLAAAAASGLRVVVTLHDFFAFCPVGSYFDYRAGTRCNVDPMSRACVVRHCDRASFAHKAVRVARQWNTKRAFGRCADLTFVHVSDVARRVAEPFLPLHARHAVIENMIEAGAPAPADPAGNDHVLFLGRFSFEKGVLLLAEAARRARMPVRFVGEGELAGEIARINPEAECLPWIPVADVEAEIRRARAVIVPSYFETGPLVALQAWAIGTPVLVTDGTGASGWLSDAEQALLTPVGDVEALARALARLHDPVFVAAMGQAAQKRFSHDPFTIARHLRRTLAVYGGHARMSGSRPARFEASA